MFMKRNTCMLAFLLCCLTLWSKSASAGSSFLSPSQKPQNRGKSPRVGRQAMEENIPPTDDNHVTISAPFKIGITISEDDLDEYRVILQEIVQHLLGSSETSGWLSVP
ncbi:ghrelin/obestatin prepropeptide [Amphiprion ocellaris]|uniref:Motilin/ghrelin-associated peptide domain-containing protein n=1 Tax=Amphiprion ocellaris TaxID=80972 RepID=A0AAQ5X837_AMPOC|nr:ghrelin/obestatin prepropeptide [Amphiprion ocellaris]